MNYSPKTCSNTSLLILFHQPVYTGNRGDFKGVRSDVLWGWRGRKGSSVLNRSYRCQVPHVLSQRFTEKQLTLSKPCI